MLDGIIAVPVMVVMMLVASRADIMGRFPVRGWLRGLGRVATAVMTLAMVAMLGTSF